MITIMVFMPIAVVPFVVIAVMIVIVVIATNQPRRGAETKQQDPTRPSGTFGKHGVCLLWFIQARAPTARAMSWIRQPPCQPL